MENGLKEEAQRLQGVDILGGAVLCLKVAIPVTQFHGVVSAVTMVISQSSSLLTFLHTKLCGFLANLKATQ